MSENSGGRADVVFGGQAGSEGKGAMVGYLARRGNYAAAMCNFMTNAGHTWVSEDGTETVVVQQVPMSVVAKNIPQLLVGPGSAISLKQLTKEYRDLNDRFNLEGRLKIHPNAMIIDEADEEWEKMNTLYLGSTAKGCGRALARKVMRLQDVRLAKDIPTLSRFICDTTDLVNTFLEQGDNVLVEGAQGFDLDLNHGIAYPYCTSRQTTPLQVLADSGIPHTHIGDVMAVIRSYPIRVGNVVVNGEQIGYSGPFGGKELTWAEVTERSGYPTPLEERTTVTKRVRRVFEIDHKRLRKMFQVCAPTQLAITFADYIDHSLAGMNTKTFIDMIRVEGGMLSRDKIPTRLHEFVRALIDIPGCPEITHLKTGPRNDQVIDMMEVSFAFRG